jgi:uncharacterized integral membrane protein
LYEQQYDGSIGTISIVSSTSRLEKFSRTGLKRKNNLTERRLNMNDQPQNNQPYDRLSARRQRRAERRKAIGMPGSSTWIAGLILIVLGGIFLMQNMGQFSIPFANWWALFILIPAMGALNRAYLAYKHAGNQLNASARSALFVGLILTVITGLFLFNISLTFYGPMLIILVGAGILVNSMLKSKE